MGSEDSVERSALRLNTASTGQQASRQVHLMGVEGLRGFAALAVLVTHVGEHSTDGDAGIATRVAGWGAEGLTLFFALSGFLLYSQFVTNLLDGKSFPSVRVYLERRAFRIYPGYLFAFVVLNFGASALYLHGTNLLYGDVHNIGRITEPGVLIPNLFLVQSLIPHTVASGIGPAWSLTTELTFYIALIPLAGMAFACARRMSRVWAAAVPAVIMIVVGIVTGRLIAHAKGDLDPMTAFDWSWGHHASAVLDRGLLARADLFGYGMLAAVVVAWLRVRGVERVSKTLRGSLLLAIAVIVLAALVHGPREPAIGVCAGALLALVVLPSSRPGRQNRLARALDWPPIRGLGVISYSVYLWHEPTIFFLMRYHLLRSSGASGLAINVLVVSGVVIIIATCSYHLVEKPAQNLIRTWQLSRRGRVVVVP